MDGLSGVASGIAVVSLAVQLTQCVDTIKSFIRNVKGASRELERLSDLLERLSALLQDVRQAMELQCSRAGQHCPPPSMTIFNSLTSCASHLKPLQQAVQKLEKSSTYSKAAKLRADIRVGLKTKDIAGYEARIQQEIINLSAALVVNSTSIQLHALPLFIGGHPATTSMVLTLPTNDLGTHDAPNDAIAPQDSPMSSPRTSLAFRQRTQLLRSSLERYGFYQQRVVRSLRRKNNDLNELECQREIVLSETNMYFCALRVLGYGICLARDRPYGSILPSLSVYPLVSSWDKPLSGVQPVYPGSDPCASDLIWGGTLHQIQHAFSTGALHPFTRNESGQSLLHLAAKCSRADVCRLLIQLGVRSELSRYGCAPLCLLGASPLISGGAPEEAFKVLLLDSPGMHAFEHLMWYSSFMLPKPYVTLDLIRWLKGQRADLLCDSDYQYFMDKFLRSSLRLLHIPSMHSTCFEIFDEILTPNTQTRMETGSMALLSFLFGMHIKHTSIDSFFVGSTFIRLLQSLGIDWKACITNETNRCGIGTFLGFPSRQLVFGGIGEQTWMLGWVWRLDEAAVGHLLVSEYLSLGADYTSIGDRWPFSSNRYPPYIWGLEKDEPKLGTRFNRRMAAKARKELKRKGLKQVRNSMPGSWIE